MVTPHPLFAALLFLTFTVTHASARTILSKRLALEESVYSGRSFVPAAALPGVYPRASTHHAAATLNGTHWPGNSSLPLTNGTLTLPLINGTSSPTSDNSTRRLVVAYFGQNPRQANGATLETYCEDPAIDVIVLGFMHKLFASGGLPGSDHSDYCPDKVDGTELSTCPQWEDTIKQCQSKHRKKILLSIGGATMEEELPSAAKARQLADTVWKLYGEGTGLEEKRPFKTAVLDGFDLDIEHGKPTHYPDLVAQFRQRFAAEGTKRYVLTGAPQCPRPDPFLGATVDLLDYVFVQFYNNAPCMQANMFFSADSSAQQWSQQLLHAASAVSNPKFFVGIPGDSNAAPAGGYIDPDDLAEYARKLSRLPNFGGFMTWDAESAGSNMQASSGVSYLRAMKAALMQA